MISQRYFISHNQILTGYVKNTLAKGDIDIPPSLVIIPLFVVLNIQHGSTKERLQLIDK
jgi:hypothetical protein